jgi:hypothetical protein
MGGNSASRASTVAALLLTGCLSLGGCGSSATSPSATGSAPPPPAIPTMDPPAPAVTQAPHATQPPAHGPTPAPSPAAVADSWVRLADLSVPRDSLKAFELADGRVFVIDATYNVISDLGGGPQPPGPTDILDPQSGRWTKADPLNAPRSAFVAARLHDGRVLVTGGDNGLYGAYSSTKLFDPATGHWTATGLLNTARIGPVGALLADGRVLIAGGTYSAGYTSEGDFFTERSSGIDERSLTSAEIYDPKTGRWSKTGSLHHLDSAGEAFVLPDGKVLAAGSTCELYDPTTEAWTEVAGCPDRPEWSATVVLADGSLLVIGGQTEVPGTAPDGSTEEVTTPLATVTRFEPSTGTITKVASLPAPRAGAVAVRLADGRVLVAGGTDVAHAASTSAVPLSETFIYDPVLDSWAESTPMPFADFPLAGLLLSDGSVLVAGGLVPVKQQDADGSWADPVRWSARFVPGTATGD